MGIIRKTKSVRALLDVFEHSDEAFSSVNLVEKFKPEMNKTTVYRILERLEGEGLLHSFSDQNGLKWYGRCKECSSQHHEDLHPHFQCKDCGKVECLHIDLSIPSIPHHKVDRAELLLIGQCSECLS